MIVCNHTERGDDVGDSDKGVLNKPFLEDTWVADFDCDGGDTDLHGCSTQGTSWTCIVYDDLKISQMEGVSGLLEGSEALPFCEFDRRACLHGRRGN